MSHLDNNPAVKSQHEGWKAARARMGIAGRPKPISIPVASFVGYEPAQAPTKPQDAATRKRAAARERARLERAERIRLQIEADRKALEETRAEANQRIRAIILATAGYFQKPTSELLSDRKTTDIMLPRQVAMYLAKELTPQSYPNIGRRFRRDHTTVLHAVRKIESMLAKGNPVVTLAVAAIRENLDGGEQ